jgi:hypothetical protein
MAVQKYDIQRPEKEGDGGDHGVQRAARARRGAQL